MDFHQNFTCPLCLELAKEAVESSCCTKILCYSCVDQAIKKYGNCPCCRSKEINIIPSKIARKVISEIKVPCELCELKIELGNMKQHFNKCPKIKITCRFCGACLLQQDAPKHTATQHPKQAREYLTKMVIELKKQKPNNSSKIVLANPHTHNYFKPVTNSKGRKAALGSTSKYYCGGQLLGRCECCDGFCGPDSGENCDACMELDIKRWNLSRTYLINTIGYICQVLRVQGIPRVCCFRLISAKMGGLFSKNEVNICRAGFPCPPCSQVQNSIRLGRYEGLF